MLVALLTLTGALRARRGARSRVLNLVVNAPRHSNQIPCITGTSSASRRRCTSMSSRSI
jgi:hypothetical protein